MNFELFIARRYLRAKRRQAVIGIITAISIIGVAAGVASLIIALAINNGFRQDLQQRLLGSTSHVSLLRVQSDGIKDWPALLDRYNISYLVLSKDDHPDLVAEVRQTSRWQVDYEDDQAVVFSRIPSTGP